MCDFRISYKKVKISYPIEALEYFECSPNMEVLNCFTNLNESPFFKENKTDQTKFN